MIEDLEKEELEKIREEYKNKIKQEKKEYIILNKREEADEEDIVKILLRGRGIKEEEKFLKASLDDLEENIFLNEEKVVARIISALMKKEKIGIYGDYDGDGISGCALGVNILRGLGGDICYYINDRFTEGFGINKKGVEELSQKKVKLIITVDNGIAGVEGVKRAQELGIDVIVTDHHEPNEEIPDCLIIDPKQKDCPYPNKDITGVGVLFKILLKVCIFFKRKNLALKNLDLVALGTVTDMAPLVGENRVFVKNGLILFNWEKGKEQYKVLKRLWNLNRNIKSYDLGFILGPMINAESRLYGRPVRAIEFLISEDPRKIEELAIELIEINHKRKEIMEKQILLGEELVNPEKDLIFIYHPFIEEGLAGLISSRLMDQYEKPTIVLGSDREGNLKGSGRSFGNFNLKENIDKVSKLLLKYGGHELACGLSLKEENLVTVRNILETNAKRFYQGEREVKKGEIDLLIKVEEINEALLEKLQILEPFGIGFKKPIFLIREVRASSVNYLKEIHSKFLYQGIEFISFNNILEGNKKYNVLGFPKINEFKGKRTIQFMIESILEEDSLVEG